MSVIGTIVRLQVQCESLKVGAVPSRRYDPAPLRHVVALTLSEDGVEGWTAEGDAVPDVHNRTHPASKNREGRNGISVGFTSHYRLMQDRFGEHLTEGIAGENLLIALAEPKRTIHEDELRGGLRVETASGKLILLDQLVVAAPCVEFARYALQFPDDARPDRTVTEAVQFLHEGVRGCYATYQGPAVRVNLGAWVSLQ